MALGFLRGCREWFRLSLDAFLAPNLSFSIRWRMLAAQPIILLGYSLASFPWLFRRPFKVEYLPIAPGRSVRVLVFKAPGDPLPASGRKLRPLHLNCHAGAFIGGLPEGGAPFCDKISRETGAVVVSTTYRFAPRHHFPAAIDDVDAVLAYLRANAQQKFGADPDLITVSGFSAGGNLALAASLSVPPGIVKASVTFYAAIDLRLKPEDKPRPANFPKKDPLQFMLPLYDTYSGPVRVKERDNPRMSPILAELERLPENMLLVVPGIDIVVHEQSTFVERLNREKEGKPEHSDRRIERLYVEKAFHGWVELPSPIVKQEEKDFIFGTGIEFIKDSHRKAGWMWA